MPCEACNIQFTVFKRKKSCTECRRLYCSNCLTKNKERILCKRCVIFTTRPLSKIELLKLKAKDLIFYLQSKHISTTGCVEKEELVNLVLIHVDNSNNFTPDLQQSPTSISMGISDQSDDDPRSNPFDQIRNTCQNLFTTFTEKIAADFNFDFKQNQSDRQTNVCEDQPRYSDSFENVPSFNSNVTNNATSTTSNNSGNISKLHRTHRSTTIQTSSVNQSTQMVSPPVDNAFSNINNNYSNAGSGSGRNHTTGNLQTLPTITGDSSNASDSSILKSISSEDGRTTAVISRIIPQNGMQSPSTIARPMLNASTSTTYKPLASSKITELSKTVCENDVGSSSGCECSDDELIIELQENSGDQLISPVAPSLIETTMAAAQAISSSFRTTKLQLDIDNNLTATMTTAPLSSSMKVGNNILNATSIVDSLDIASFEDCGAVGGLQTNITPNDTDSKWNIDDTASTSSNVENNVDKNVSTTSVSYTTNLPNSITKLPQVNHSSDNQRHNTQLDEMITNDTKITFPQEHSTVMNESEQQQQQQRNTDELRSKLEKALKSRRQMHRKITRRQSDGIVYTASTSNPSHRTARFLGNVDDDGGDDDEERSTSTSEEFSLHKSAHKLICRKCGKTKGNRKKFSAIDMYGNEDTDDDDDDDNYDPSFGIHVYGSNNDTNTTSTHPPRQFFDLNTIEKKQELEDLSVKQLKEVLMLNRIDFKGCCEKSELLERVQRLWDDRRNCPAVDKLATVDLCKICMDAAIECVLLECGHMATCTNCGKVLSECPICRQYIVRVVRFFKA
ncbi:rho GTPase-activating protein gacZ [Sitodiplosis mosellana]|uniref:rho GTPase-activating protein gacZ n=1 Tax=Sitodiplosis mosellana TaxID=263140 RepID=UPI00244508FB|nr:rho GTPase-activating protein gacZ [Sitodiplosis mosellana]XP_055316109.1 rho GTPase-activating protein gacZ [Sitodiplosis mosellana]